MVGDCQGCSLRLTGTRGLVGEGGVKGVLDAFGGQDGAGNNQYDCSDGEETTEDWGEIRREGRLQVSYF